MFYGDNAVVYRNMSYTYRYTYRYRYTGVCSGWWLSTSLGKT